MSVRPIYYWENLLEGVTEGDFRVLPHDEDVFDADDGEKISIVANYHDLDEEPSYVMVGEASPQHSATLANARLLAASKDAVEELVRVLHVLDNISRTIDQTHPDVAEMIRRTIVDTKNQEPSTKFATLDDVTLTYVDDDNNVRTQTLYDLDQVGTLVDGDTGEELTMTEVIISKNNKVIASIGVDHVDLVYDNQQKQPLADFPEVSALFDDEYGDFSIIGVEY